MPAGGCCRTRRKGKSPTWHRTTRTSSQLPSVISRAIKESGAASVSSGFFHQHSRRATVSSSGMAGRPIASASSGAVSFCTVTTVSFFSALGRGYRTGPTGASLSLHRAFSTKGGCQHDKLQRRKAEAGNPTGENIQHPTSNIQHPMPALEEGAGLNLEHGDLGAAVETERDREPTDAGVDVERAHRRAEHAQDIPLHTEGHDQGSK